jgi:hypothetical protein
VNRMRLVLPDRGINEGNKAPVIVISRLHSGLESLPAASFSLCVTTTGVFALPSESRASG